MLEDMTKLNKNENKSSGFSKTHKDLNHVMISVKSNKKPTSESLSGGYEVYLDKNFNLKKRDNMSIRSCHLMKSLKASQNIIRYFL